MNRMVRLQRTSMGTELEQTSMNSEELILHLVAWTHEWDGGGVGQDNSHQKRREVPL